MEFKKGKLVRFNDSQNLEKTLPVHKTSAPLFKTEGGIINDRNTSGKVPTFGRFKVFPENNHKPYWREKILDPGSDVILKWNRIFLFSCLTALFVDPLFCYLPSVISNGKSTCMDTDLNLGITVTCFRTFADVFYMLHIVIKFRTAYVSPSSRVFGRGELVMDPELIARRYLKSDFFIDLIAALPLPQVLGASWYLLSIERHATCWKSACKHESSPIPCKPRYLDCGTLNFNDRKSWENTTVLFSICNPANKTFFDYGIFAKALEQNVLSSEFLEKFLYCLWWGLQNLSSYGQSLSTSTFIGETAFAILIAIMGLVLFAHLIGNMQTKSKIVFYDDQNYLWIAFFDTLPLAQTYLQSITVRLEEWRLKRRDTEEWMRHRQLPQTLRERVRRTQGTCIVREGDPLTEMLFIIRGKLESSTTNGGRTGFFNSIILRPGDFCGEELLAWALLPKSTLNLPSSTRTVRALEEVEAFALQAEDLKFVANQFRRLHSKKLQHTFRFYSYHWRTWATCFIQAAWRRHKKRMMAKSLSMSESFSLSADGQTAR
uniref:Cyclic nucleotide-binding domain-containing protein n=1 Tax=Salix viminalis TaxID=40686 RepID=A0A6N2KII1_SALVM